VSIFITFYCALSIEIGTLAYFGLEGVKLGVFLIIVNLVIFSLAISFALSNLRVERNLRKYKEWKVCEK
jgi:hypothetical protein